MRVVLVVAFAILIVGSSAWIKQNEEKGLVAKGKDVAKEGYKWFTDWGKKKLNGAKDQWNSCRAEEGSCTLDGAVNAAAKVTKWTAKSATKIGKAAAEGAAEESTKSYVGWLFILYAVLEYLKVFIPYFVLLVQVYWVWNSRRSYPLEARVKALEARVKALESLSKPTSSGSAQELTAS
jgi:hypothetical protein